MKRVACFAVILTIVLSACKTQDINRQWSLSNTSQKINGAKGVAGIDIGMPEPSPLVLSDRDNIIAIVDSGIPDGLEAFKDINIQRISGIQGEKNDHGISACAYIINQSGFSASEAKELLLNSAVHLESLQGKVCEGRFLSIGFAIDALQNR